MPQEQDQWVLTLENNQNLARRLDNTSGQTGVSYMRTRKKWSAYIHSYGKRINLGYFAAFEDAVRVRLEAERRYDFHPNHGREPFANIAAAIADVVRSRITSRMGETQHAS